MKSLLIIGSIFAAFSVLLGAFGAHGLKSKINPMGLEIFETGVKYQMYHSLGLIIIGLMGFQFKNDILTTPVFLLFSGTIIFSGSLYILALTNLRWFGAITPIGGVCLVLGWTLLSFNLFRY